MSLQISAPAEQKGITAEPGCQLGEGEVSWHPQGIITQQFAEGKRKDLRLQPGAGIKAIKGLRGLIVLRALAFSAEKFPRQLSQRGRGF